MEIGNDDIDFIDDDLSSVNANDTAIQDNNN